VSHSAQRRKGFANAHSITDYVFRSKCPAGVLGLTPESYHIDCGVNNFRIYYRKYAPCSSSSTFLASQQLCWFSKQYGLTDQHFLFTVLPKTFDCTPCVKCYCFVQGTGRRSSSFKLSCNLFGMSPAVNNTGGTVQAVWNNTRCEQYRRYGTDRLHLPFSYKLFCQVCIFLELLGDGAAKVVTVSNC